MGRWSRVNAAFRQIDANAMVRESCADRPRPWRPESSREHKPGDLGFAVPDRDPRQLDSLRIPESLRDH